MASKRITENPTIADTVVFDILTPDADGCFVANPYKVDSVTIYFIERDFNSGNAKRADYTVDSETLKASLAAAKTAACADPSEDNLALVVRIQNELELARVTNTLSYREARVVAQIGTSDLPAWLSTDADEALIDLIDEDENGDAQYGRFEFQWNPLGMREGDYYVCWTWTPQMSGSSLSFHEHFTLGGSTQLTTSIPTHFTQPGKYETLLERYTPEMFKLTMSDNDLSPQVIQEFNKAVAAGFAVVEDMSNQLVDLLDANATHESLLVLLGNTLGVKLRSTDPTLWRRQIKNAVPFYKQKGTLRGLSHALSQAGIGLNKFTRMWQVISKYTFQEAINVAEDGQVEFALSQTVVGEADENFEAYYRAVDSSTWSTLDINDFEFEDSTATYSGTTIFEAGDTIRLVYKIVEVPDEDEQSLEGYIRLLPLADERDERAQEYPKKNWNVRLIAEDDALFDVVIADRHPYHDDVVFGKVRTEFPYSENIYNMEEYNGSKRDSTSPCDIDRDFLDPCSYGQSSKYTVDLEIENLCDDRIAEAQDILRDYTPFHSILHGMNVVGLLHDFVRPPVENVESLVTVSGQEVTVIDPPQMIFNRTMTSSSLLQRSDLANMTTVVSGQSGQAKNVSAVLFSPNVNLGKSAIDEEHASLTYLEVLSPSSNAGTFSIDSIDGHYARIVSGYGEPLDEAAFTFRLSNEVVRKTTSASISQTNSFYFSEDEMDFLALGVRTSKDVSDDPSYDGGVWRVAIPAYGTSYVISDIASDGSLILTNNGSLPTSTTTGVNYTLRDDTNSTVYSSSAGKIKVKKVGLVDLSGGTVQVKGTNLSASAIQDVRSLIDSGYYLLASGTQYRISGFVPDTTHQFYIDNWTGGNVSGITVVAYQRLIDGATGYFHYSGLKLITGTDHEAALGIQNGQNAPDEDDVTESDHFKENYLVLIGSDYYTISEIDGTTITLSGPKHNWKVSGTTVTYNIVRFTKPSVTIDERFHPNTAGHAFDFIDRRGNEVFTIETGTVSNLMVAESLNALNNGGPTDVTGQKENISFSIEWAD